MALMSKIKPSGNMMIAEQKEENFGELPQIDSSSKKLKVIPIATEEQK